MTGAFLRFSVIRSQRQSLPGHHLSQAGLQDGLVVTVRWTLLLLHRQGAERLDCIGNLALVRTGGLNIFRKDRADCRLQGPVPLHQRAVAVEGDKLWPRDQLEHRLPL